MRIRLFMLALFLLCAPLRAGENVWTPIGPEGGTVKSLAFAANGRTAYAGTATGQVFRSADAGRTWTMTAPNLGGAVRYLEADPFQSGKVYATTTTALFRSDDAGRSWSDLSSRLPGVQKLVFVRALAADPLSPGVVYVAVYDGEEAPLIFRSADHGSSWQIANTGLPPNDIQALAVHPRQRGVLFAGTGDGLFRSVDSGRTWHPFGLGDEFIVEVEVDAQDPSRLYAVKMVPVDDRGTTTPRIVFSEDGGGSWTQTSPEQVYGIRDERLVADPFVAGTAYYITESGPLYKTTDGGRHWEIVHEQPPLHEYNGTSALAVNPRRPGMLLVSQVEPGDPPVLRSADRGATWAASSAGLRALGVTSGGTLWFSRLGPIHADPARRGLLYLGLWRTPDYGRTWLGPGIPPEPGPGLLGVDPVRPATVYFASSGLLSPPSLFKSTDRGRTWTRMGDAPDIALLLLTVTEPGTLYATSVGKIYRSTDDGAHWETLPARDFETQFLAAAPGRPSTLYTGNAFWLGDDVRRSTDNGATWTTVLEMGVRQRWIHDLAIDPHHRNRVLVAFARMDESYRDSIGGGVYRTVDGGATWQLSRLPESPPAFSLLFDPRRPSRVYAGSFGQVFLSEDGGVTWVPLGPGLPHARVGDLEVDPFDPRTIYAATEGGLYSLTYHPGR